MIFKAIKLIGLLGVFLTAAGVNELRAGTETLFDHNHVFRGWQKKHENETVVFERNGRLFLGGKSNSGEQCGIFKEDLKNISNWQLMLNIAWSHNKAIGGHPTSITFADKAGNGYRLNINSGKLEISKVTGNAVVVLGKTALPGFDLTQPKYLFFTRDNNSKMTAWIEGVPARLEEVDTEYRRFETLTISYGVYRHGYAAIIDRITLKTADDRIKTAENSASFPTVAWNHPAIGIGILDSEQFSHPFLRTGWTSEAATRLARNGIKVELIPPGELSRHQGKIDLLIINAGMIADVDLAPLMEFVKAGKILWLTGTQPLGNAVFEQQDKRWSKINADKLSEPTKKIIHRLSERLLGTVPVQRDSYPSNGNTALFVTPDGSKVWPFLSGTIKADNFAFLPWNDSIAKQTLPAWVKKEILLSWRYDKKNWIQRKDTFTGMVVELMTHTAGEFAGARIIYTGFPLTGASPLNPQRPEFVPWTTALLNRMASIPQAAAKNILPQENLPLPDRQNLLSYPGGVMAPLCFNSQSYINDDIFVEDLELGGFAVCQFSISWLNEADQNGEVIDWKKMDTVMDYMSKIGKKIILDPYHFRWHSLKWSNQRSIHDPVFKERFIKAMTSITERYRNNPTLVAMMITPHTHTYNFKVDNSPAGKIAWRRYLETEKNFSLDSLRKRYGQPIPSWDQLPLPVEDKNIPYNVGPLWADYWNFHVAAYHEFMRDIILAIRKRCPEMPLLLRGPYLEVGINMKIAAEFKNVACHCECVETTIDTEGYFRSLSKRFNVPIGAENGWPKASLPALKMAMADYLMGDYQLFLYSFAGPRWGREGFQEFRDAAKLKRQMSNAGYPSSTLGLLIADTTLFASRPPNFFAMEKLPHLEGVMERLGFYFEGVSAAFPRLEGLKIVIDDGSNYVISPELRTMLTKWIGNGGTFIMYQHTGTVISDGSKPTLAAGLNLPATPGRYQVGKGNVIILERIPNADPASLNRLLLSLHAARDFVISPFINNAVMTGKDGKKFLILYNKNPKLLGAFFTESWESNTLAKLQPLEVSISPTFRFSTARNMRTGKKLTVEENRVKIVLPPTEYAVIEFD